MSLPPLPVRGASGTRSRPRPAAPAAGPRPQVRARDERRARWRRPGRRLSYAVLALAPVGVLVYLLLSSSLLAVERVQVLGAARLPVTDLVARAGVPVGTPLARVDLAAVRARLAAVPDVAVVRVERGWPNTVRVRVTERTAVATAQQGDQWLLVDGAGVRFSPAPVRPGGLPQLSGEGAAAAAAGSVLAALPSVLRDQVAGASAATPEQVLLTLRDGRSVAWGSPQGSARKAAVVQALLPRPGRTLDVSSGTLAVVRGAG